MNFPFSKLIKGTVLLLCGVLLLTSCNKENLDAVPITSAPSSQQSIIEIVNANANFSILKAAIARASTSSANPSLTTLLSNANSVYTVFAPSDQAFLAAFQLLGIPSSIGINAFSPGRLDTLIRYHIVGGQRILTDSIARRSPNLQLPSLFPLAAPSTSIPPGLRMSIFPSKNGDAFWVNNLPMQGQGVSASNGLIYPLGFVALPPSTFLWNRISDDPNMTYFKAAILRADSGSTAANSLVAALSNPAANFTALIPTDAAVKQMLTFQITAALVKQGIPQDQAVATATFLASTPAVFSNPLLFPYLPARDVKGLVAYHLLGTDPIVTKDAATNRTVVTVNGIRVFAVNIPQAGKTYKTYLNSDTTAYLHPGVAAQATFGASGVTAATFKGFKNPSPSNVLINPSLGTGTSDQHYINGVLHVIDQVLIPQ